MAIQFGKYKRNGIFIEEINKSIFSTPITEGLNNLVIGVSKKGPVNTPIRLTTVNDLESIFGTLDRNLERNGSFFHRTVSKMLETTPVYAVNLLLTDDTLDKIEYKTLSTSALNENDIKREGAYRRFFDTTGFWKRDTDSFINLTKNDVGYEDRALGFTNLSDKNITVFVVKSTKTGYDRTLLEWYGSAEKIPPYVKQTDYAADYLVDVVVVGGDWSNYKDLSVDSRWSAYFNADGLIKSQLRNFANDRNINLLGYYDGLSLIPYFRDLRGNNIFIETVLNTDTDKTGLFCYFNSDLVEQNFYNGLVDLLGNTLVGQNKKTLDFLSYNETISESVDFIQTPLDLPGNVTAIYGTTSTHFYGSGSHAFGTPSESGIITNPDTRTGFFGEGNVYDVAKTEATTISGSYSVQYSVTNNSYVVINDTYVPVTATGSFTINPSTYGFATASATYSSVFVIDNSGEIKMINATTKGTKPSVSVTDVVLGYVDVVIASQSIVGTPSFVDISVNNVGFKGIEFGTNKDFTITEVVSGSGDAIKIEFRNTSGTITTKNYEQYRKVKLFNRLINLLDSSNKDKMSMVVSSTMTKLSLENITISNIITSTELNKSFVLNTGLTSTELNDFILKGNLVFYTIDNELILGTDGVETKNVIPATDKGVVGKYSDFYLNYFNGVIETNDYVYDNRLYADALGEYNNYTGVLKVEFLKVTTGTYSGRNYLIVDDNSMDLQTSGEQLLFPDSLLNTGTITIKPNGVDNNTAEPLAIALGKTGFAFEVVENVVNETLENINLIYNYGSKHILTMFLNSSNDLSATFDKSVDTNVLNSFLVQSEKSNLKQTLEIEIPTGYVQVPNKILVNGSRYSEVKVGDFIEADITNIVLETGEVARKLTRILSKKQYVGNTELTEITCDSAINKVNISGDYQTTRYSSIDQYASTYKAISLKGFRIRNASLPDGTETRQNQILNLVAKGTPLFKALTNKEAFDFRYLVDAFGLGLVERSKQQLVDICGSRLDVVGFINMPSIRSFKNSSSPTFVNTEGVLQAEYIAKGGNPESNPAFLYSFGDGAGASCVGYFTPYVTVNDNGRPLEFPPASFVATTYMRKHISNISSVTPWTVAAGTTNGKITNIAGLEIDFDNTDLEWLFGAKINPIVYKRNRGYVIENEFTAETLYESSLSYLHAREVLVELERELSRMLLDFQWKGNTPDIRAEIKLKADTICETFVSKNGLYNYFNKMDDENNTPDIIDSQIGVLDTYVEIIKDMGIIINNVNILRTGAIQSGGFING